MREDVAGQISDQLKAYNWTFNYSFEKKSNVTANRKIYAVLTKMVTLDLGDIVSDLIDPTYIVGVVSVMSVEIDRVYIK